LTLSTPYTHTHLMPACAPRHLNCLHRHAAANPNSTGSVSSFAFSIVAGNDRRRPWRAKIGLGCAYEKNCKSQLSQISIRKGQFVGEVTPQMALQIEQNGTVFFDDICCTPTCLKCQTCAGSPVKQMSIIGMESVGQPTHHLVLLRFWHYLADT
jgi:hypothetical protein